jgi:hypothetical protein
MVNPSNTTHVPPRWLRIEAAVEYSGISRSRLYELMAEDAIKTHVIRKRYAVRGLRLIDRLSIDAFISNAPK